MQGENVRMHDREEKCDGFDKDIGGRCGGAETSIL